MEVSKVSRNQSRPTLVSPMGERMLAKLNFSKIGLTFPSSSRLAAKT